MTLQFTQKSRTNFAHQLLHYGFILLLLGRFWQYFFWDIPLREWLWSVDYASPLMTWLCQCTWEEYLSSRSWDQGIQWAIKIQGIALACIAVLIGIPGVSNKIKTVASYIAFGILTILSLCLFKENFFRIGFLIELAAQWFIPLLYIYIVLGKNDKYRIVFLKIVLALTFIGHGLYAVGFYPIPGIFVDMIISGFHVSEDTAIMLLNIAGYLDLIVALGLFIPGLYLLSVQYMIVWGILTTFARVFTQVHFDGLFWDTFNQWAFETLIRNVHFVLPITLWLYSFNSRVSFNQLKFSPNWKKLIYRFGLK